MNTDEKDRLQTKVLLVCASIVLGSGALWLAWLRYRHLINEPDFYWYNWIQLAGIAIIGILSLCAAILFILGRRSARSLFTFGLSLIPILLFANLMVFLFRVFQNILQGNAIFFLERLFAQPYKVIVVLLIVIALTVLRSLNERKN
jgi:hypothetical protein